MSLPCGCGRDEKKLKPDLMESLSMIPMIGELGQIGIFYQVLSTARRERCRVLILMNILGRACLLPSYPILEFELFPKFVDRIKGYASLAIKQYFGNDGKERTVTEILKLNAGCPRDYITFKIDNEGKEETFQAKVERTIERIPICRRKV
ncbi:hypothetical protein H5410_048263 [Solanum commersonii]|uniref:Uncharacterized protein n=1 Tax=Solanum commersonii TaxID=4109 RepID=A0A9J5XJ86_SOLCO|nr:hypothetical protein H5410_048263 [Solanum commersonii]